MIVTTSSSIAYSGNASTSTPYPIPFPFLHADHILAWETDENGTVTPLDPGDFTVSANYAGGRIVSGALLTDPAIPTTSTLTIRRLTPALQTSDFVQGGRLDAEAFETALDRVTMVAQEAVRDALGGGETNVEAAGAGIVVQTAPGVFETRQLVADPTGRYSVVNGDGVAGNPSIDLAAGGNTRFVQFDLWDATGGSGYTRTNHYWTVTNSATGDLRRMIQIPKDWDGVTALKVIPRIVVVTADGPGSGYVMKLALRSYQGQTVAAGSIIAATAHERELNWQSSSDSPLHVFTLGADSAVAPGEWYWLDLKRVIGDTEMVGNIQIDGVTLQYRAVDAASF